MEKRPVVLCIMDGLGLRKGHDHNAVFEANTPNLCSLMKEYPFVEGQASGLFVGLPDGQMGNSEVGHMNMGAGRIIYQELTRISKAIEDGDFFENKALLAAVENAKKNNSALHLMGLVSSGGVHSHNTHIYGLLELAKRNGLKEVYVHAFLDGRDTSPTSGKEFVAELEKEMAKIGVGKVASVMGRFYAMDRDNRWDRVEAAYSIMTKGGNLKKSATGGIQESYDEGKNDEFVVPFSVDNDGAKTIKDKDSVIFFNFRPDRAREMTRVFCVDDFDGFNRGKRLDTTFVCFTDYDESIGNKLVAFEKEEIKDTFGEFIAEHGMKQLVDAIKSGKYDVIIINFANPDMVGHTAVENAAIKAVETVDECIGKTVEAIKEVNGVMFICADHGNCETLVDEETGEPHTAHTTNPVPFILVNADPKYTLAEGGRLCDIVPTLIELMGLQKPAAMTGKSLLVEK